MDRSNSEIWVYGTFDVDNFGDLLFPYILDRKLSDHGRIVPVSPEGIRTQFKDALPASPVSLNGKPQLILIGGGNIVTRELKQLAEHPTWRFDTDIAGLSLWLGALFQALRLRVPLIWNIPGCLPPLEFSGALKEAVNRWINEASSFPVRLRDESSARLFAQFYDGPIEVYPDSVFSIIDIFSREELRERAASFKSSHGINGPHMICQIKPAYIDTSYQAIADFLNRIASERSLTIILLPLGLCHGDIKALIQVSQFLTCPYYLVDDNFSIEDTISLLGTASLTITSSYHASIICSLYESPFCVVAPPILAKFDDLEKSLGFARAYSWTDLFSGFVPGDPRLIAQRASKLSSSLVTHWNDIERICIAENPAFTSRRPLPTHYIDQQPIARSSIFSSLVKKPCYQSNRDKCPICGSTRFASGGSAHFRRRRVCSTCGSRPRHRAVYSTIKKLNIDFSNSNALMFSRDPSVDPTWFHDFEHSIYQKSNHIDLQCIDRPSDSYDFIFLNHVLEHVDDHKRALSELQRILRSEGILFITVPSPALFNHTNDWGFPDPDLHLHYRTYGRDFFTFLSLTCHALTIYEMEARDPITQAPDYIYVCHKTSNRRFNIPTPLSLSLPELQPLSVSPVLEDGLWHVRRLLETRCIARANRSLEKLRLSFPLDLRVAMLEADLHHLTSNTTAESKVLSYSNQISPNNRAVILRQARLLRKSGKYDDAITLLKSTNIISSDSSFSLDEALVSVLYLDR